MWRTFAAVAVLLVAGFVLLVPFHPEAPLLHALVAATPRTPLAWHIDWFLVESGGNVLMFAAIGVANCLLLRRTLAAVSAACLVSAGAELAQLAIPNRVASWSDFVTNALGAVVGVLLAAIVLPQLRAPGARKHTQRQPS